MIVRTFLHNKNNGFFFFLNTSHLVSAQQICDMLYAFREKEREREREREREKALHSQKLRWVFCVCVFK